MNRFREGLRSRKDFVVTCELVPGRGHTGSSIDAILKLLTDSEKGVLESLEDLYGVGHRVVHGGEDFTGSVVIDRDVLKL